MAQRPCSGWKNVSLPYSVLTNRTVNIRSSSSISYQVSNTDAHVSFHRHRTRLTDDNRHMLMNIHHHQCHIPPTNHRFILLEIHGKWLLLQQIIRYQNRPTIQTQASAHLLAHDGQLDILSLFLTYIHCLSTHFTTKTNKNISNSALFHQHPKPRCCTHNDHQQRFFSIKYNKVQPRRYLLQIMTAKWWCLH